nr:collagen alpha-1(III) chain-like [Dasypus novemcinctus]
MPGRPPASASATRPRVRAPGVGCPAPAGKTLTFDPWETVEEAVGISPGRRGPGGRAGLASTSPGTSAAVRSRAGPPFAPLLREPPLPSPGSRGEASGRRVFAGARGRRGGGRPALCAHGFLGRSSGARPQLPPPAPAHLRPGRREQQPPPRAGLPGPWAAPDPGCWRPLGLVDDTGDAPPWPPVSGCSAAPCSRPASE